MSEVEDALSTMQSQLQELEITMATKEEEMKVLKSIYAAPTRLRNKRCHAEVGRRSEGDGCGARLCER